MIFTPLKLLSALIIVGACFFAGASVAEAENTSYRQLSGILALLAHIRTRITYTHFSLEVIFADFYDDALEKCGFLACLKDARGGYSASFCEAVGRLTVTGETHGTRFWPSAARSAAFRCASNTQRWRTPKRFCRKKWHACVKARKKSGAAIARWAHWPAR